MIQSVPRHKPSTVPVRARLLDIDPHTATTAHAVDRALASAPAPRRKVETVAFNSAI